MRLHARLRGVAAPVSTGWPELLPDGVKGAKQRNAGLAARHQRAVAEDRLKRGGGVIVACGLAAGQRARITTQEWQLTADGLGKITCGHGYLKKNVICRNLTGYLTVRQGAHKIFRNKLKNEYRAGRTQAAAIEKQIDENLRRVYEQDTTQQIPDRSCNCWTNCASRSEPHDRSKSAPRRSQRRPCQPAG